MASLYTETITAMSSIFTPAAGCSSSWTFEASQYNSIPNGLLIQNLNEDGFDTACFPTDYGMYGRAPSSIQVYSPGACPSGYQTPGVFNNDGTTTAICCQSGYSYVTSFSTINYFTSSSVLFMGCLSTFEGTTSVIARANDSDLASTVVSGPLTMWGQPITVEYEQQDLALFGITSTGTSSALSSFLSSTSSATSTSSAGITSAASSNSTSPLDKSSSGMSTGAKVATAISVALIVLIAAVVGIVWIMRRRHRRLNISPSTEESEHLEDPKWMRRELEGDSLVNPYYQQETKPLPHTPYNQPPVEMSSPERSGVVSELE